MDSIKQNKEYQGLNSMLRIYYILMNVKFLPLADVLNA
jgi:hypothetical protein